MRRVSFDMKKSGITISNPHIILNLLGCPTKPLPNVIKMLQGTKVSIIYEHLNPNSTVQIFGRWVSIHNPRLKSLFKISACRDVENFEHRFRCSCKAKVATNVFDSYAHFTDLSFSSLRTGGPGNAAIALSYSGLPSFLGRELDTLAKRLKQNSLVRGVKRDHWRDSLFLLKK